MAACAILSCPAGPGLGGAPSADSCPSEQVWVAQGDPGLAGLMIYFMTPVGKAGQKRGCQPAFPPPVVCTGLRAGENGLHSDPSALWCCGLLAGRCGSVVHTGLTESRRWCPGSGAEVCTGGSCALPSGGSGDSPGGPRLQPHLPHRPSVQLVLSLLSEKDLATSHQGQPKPHSCHLRRDHG